MPLTAESLLERTEIEDVAIRLFVATDRRDRAAVETCFTNPVTPDMTSLTGGEPLRLEPREITAAWATGFEPLDQVHHQVSNFQTAVNGTTASVRCYGVAFHHRSKITAALKTRVFVGTYDIDLIKAAGRWQIERLKFNLKFIDGNRELENAS